MSASLVGSEMCIRDRPQSSTPALFPASRSARKIRGAQCSGGGWGRALMLPQVPGQATTTLKDKRELALLEGNTLKKLGAYVRYLCREHESSPDETLAELKALVSKKPRGARTSTSAGSRAAPNHQQQTIKTLGAPHQAVSGAFRQNKNAGKRRKALESPEKRLKRLPAARRR
eukprot:2408008-Alexandrium_andersonii.AAC.1